MSQVITTTKTRKKQSAFEKLWVRAIKQKKSNEKLKVKLAEITDRMRTTILPKEIEIAKTQTPLLQKLLKLGQRKSMTNWERNTLDDWIGSILEDFQQLNLIDNDLRDHLARYDAFRMGIELEDETIPPHKQFVEIIQKAEREAQEEREREQQTMLDQLDTIREQMINEANAKIEILLDQALGKRPVITENPTADLWEDDLSSMHAAELATYDEKRESLRKTLFADKLEQIEKDLRLLKGEPADDDFDFPDLEELLDSDFDDERFSYQHRDEQRTENRTDPALSNDTFQHLFRATAAKLHPDREPDPDIRLEKQKLMASLLKARKSGDLLTVLDLYETWVGEHEGFSKTDKKTLEATLHKWLEKLEDEHEEIIMETPLHFRAYRNFHHASQKRTDKAFADHFLELQETSEVIDTVTTEITSLKTLKPWLASRYDHMMNSVIRF